MVNHSQIQLFSLTQKVKQSRAKQRNKDEKLEENKEEKSLNGK